MAVSEEERRRQSDPLERVVSREKGIEPVEKLAPAGIFGYSAGKSIIAKRIVKLFPEHKAYTEPFCGSAALFFTKKKVPTEVLNDQDQEVAFALKACRDISKEDLATLAKKNWTGSAEQFAKVRKMTPSNDLDRLYKFLYLINFSYGKGRKSFNPGVAGMTSWMTKRIEKFQPRLANTKILCGDYETAVKEHDTPDAFHFLDPPYAGYRAGGGGVGEKNFDEKRFRKFLEGLKGQFLVTYGVKGNLDTSGFEVKRMRQERTIRFMRGVKQDKYLTHLLISNFKVAKTVKGLVLDDVMGIVDTEPGQDRLTITGSRMSVSVPAALEPEPSLKNDNPLLSYPDESGPIPALVAVRFVDKNTALDISFEVGEQPIAWSIDAQRQEAAGDPRDVAKSFSVHGSRYFFPMTDGLAAKPEIDDAASALVKIDRPAVELGLQTGDLHEYFFSKGDEMTGTLVLRRDEAGGLDAKYPWIATFIDRYPQVLSDFAVLKSGAPMPPPGVSALPQSLEGVVPVDLRYWEKRGDEAVKSRDALIASRILAPENVALVDGEFARVTHKVALEDSPVRFANDSGDWVIKSIAGILPDDAQLVEVFSPDRDSIAKASGHDAVVFCDAGDALDGTIDLLAKSLGSRDGHYLVTAFDSGDARRALGKLGRVFKFRPGEDAPVDAIRRLFVASFPVRDGVDWLAKAIEDTPEGPGERQAESNRRKPSVTTPSDDTPDLGKAEWSTAYVNDLPDSAFLYVEPGGEKDEDGKTKPRSLRHFPVKDKDGKVDHAHVANALARIPQSNVPQAAKDKAKASAQRMLAQKFEESIKGDMSAAGAWPGQLQPAQGAPWKKDRTTKHVSLIAKEGDEQIVYGIVLEPDTVDAQQDIYSADEVRAACHKYMEEFQNTGFMHQKKINDQAKVVECFLAPADFTMNGQKVKKGTWCMAMHVLDSKLWKSIKDGGLTGFSIGGTAQRTPEPTSKAMRKTQYQGIPITIDRPAGYVQTGKDDAGNDWTREYKVDYGYIPRTKGGDGEGLDVFMGPNPDASDAFWIVQRKADGSFDEYKIVLGANDESEAKRIYVDHVPEKYMSAIFPMPVEQMKALLNKEPKHKIVEAP